MPPFIPQSSQAKAISDLFLITLGIGGGIFLLVLALVIIAMVRFRARPGQPEPKAVYGNKKLELAWTIIPGILLVGILVLMIGTMQRADPVVSAETQPDLIIIAHQWFWELNYPKLNIKTANEIHLPVGKPFYVEIRSADVTHSFWVPNLGRKIDATPGFSSHTTLQANAAGTYLGSCAEYCGAQHAWMKIRVIAEPQAAFDTWVSQQSQVPQTPTSGEAATGAQLFQQLSCASCHAIAGTPANKTFGPDLTHVSLRETLGAGVLTNSPDHLKSWIQDAQAYKPGALMPTFGLSDNEINALVAYLEALQ